VRSLVTRSPYLRDPSVRERNCVQQQSLDVITVCSVNASHQAASCLVKNAREMHERTMAAHRCPDSATYLNRLQLHVQPLQAFHHVLHAATIWEAIGRVPRGVVGWGQRMDRDAVITAQQA